MTRGKTDVERLGPGVAEALAGVERHALPFLEVVDLDARTALRLAQDYAGGTVYPPPEAGEIKRALDAFDEAAKREGLSDAMWSPRWVFTSAVAAAQSLAQGQAEDARKLAAAVRGWARGEDTKARERDQERSLLAFQEAFWALRRGEVPVKFSSGEDERRVEVELLGAARASGGVVLVGDSPVLATDWTTTASKHSDAYVRDVAYKVQRAMAEGARKATERRS